MHNFHTLTFGAEEIYRGKKNYARRKYASKYGSFFNPQAHVLSLSTWLLQKHATVIDPFSQNYSSGSLVVLNVICMPIISVCNFILVICTLKKLFEHIRQGNAHALVFI